MNRPAQNAAMLSPHSEMWIRSHQRARPPVFCSSSHGLAYGQHRVSASVVLFAPDGTPCPGAVCTPCAESATRDYSRAIGEEWYRVPVYQAMGLSWAAELERRAAL